MQKIILCEARHDENDQSGYEEHQMGDQTGTEIWTRDYYYNANAPWNVVLRCTKESIKNAIVIRCLQAASNENCGYGQPGRESAFAILKKDPDPSHISTPVDFDCSSLISIMTNITFRTIGVNTTVTGHETTSEMKSHFINSGYFIDVSCNVDPKTGAGLERGDIVLSESHHTAIVSSVETVADSKETINTVLTEIADIESTLTKIKEQLNNLIK